MWSTDKTERGKCGVDGRGPDKQSVGRQAAMAFALLSAAGVRAPVQARQAAGSRRPAARCARCGCTDASMQLTSGAHPSQLCTSPFPVSLWGIKADESSHCMFRVVLAWILTEVLK